MIVALHIRSDGSGELFKYDPRADDSLSVLQARVGGWIEVAPTSDPSISMYCNEEGKLLGLPWNPYASQLLYDQQFDQIAGDVVVVGRPDAEGYDTTLPETYLPKPQHPGPASD